MIVKLMFAAALACIAFVFGMLGLWVADRDPPVVGFISTTLNGDVAPGQIVRIRTQAYRIRSCHTLIERFIVDSTNTRFTFPDVDFINPGPAGPADTITELELPKRINTGLATIKTNVSWECNPVQSFFRWPIIDRQPDIAVLVTGDK